MHLKDKDMFGSVFLKKQLPSAEPPKTCPVNDLFYTETSFRSTGVKKLIWVISRGGTRIFFGWVCAAGDSLFGPALERIRPKI